MKKRLSFFLLSIIILSVYNLSAQNEIDALRYSTNTLFGTARSLGVGGAFSAVGADLSSATLNPGGLGMYRRSDIVISPILRIINNDGEYIGQNINANDTHFALASLGVVFNNLRTQGYGKNRRPVDKGLKSYTFAFGYNQVENYHRTLRGQAFNNNSSISDFFAELANADDFFLGDVIDNTYDVNTLQGLAFDTFVIDTVSTGDFFFPAVNFGRVQQDLEIREQGRKNEWFLSLAGNFSDIFFVGMTVGITSLRYEQNFFLREDDINNVHNTFQSDPNGELQTDMNRIEFRDFFATRGTGINGRFGFIVRPVDVFRFGLSVQTPTFYSLEDEFTTDLRHNFGEANVQDQSQETDIGRFEYNLTTPFQLTAGAMFLFGKRGFISADVDFIDYSNANLSSSAPLSDPTYYTFNQENANIEDFFSAALNYRVGGEFRLDPIRLRAGAALFGSALSDEAREFLPTPNSTSLEEIGEFRQMLTFGAGIRQPNFYLDVTWVYQNQNDKLNPYTLADPTIFSPTLSNTTRTNSIVLTLGFSY